MFEDLVFWRKLDATYGGNERLIYHLVVKCDVKNPDNDGINAEDNDRRWAINIDNVNITNNH